MTCNSIPNVHVYEGATKHPYNSFIGTDQFPDGHTCVCGQEVWKGISPYEAFDIIRADKEKALQEIKRFL